MKIVLAITQQPICSISVKFFVGKQFSQNFGNGTGQIPTLRRKYFLFYDKFIDRQPFHQYLRCNYRRNLHTTRVKSTHCVARPAGCSVTFIDNGEVTE